jgi:hypothetical protein
MLICLSYIFVVFSDEQCVFSYKKIKPIRIIISWALLT